MKPIKIYQTDESEPSANTKIRCQLTNVRLRWNDAARAGWLWEWDTDKKETKFYSKKPEIQNSVT